MRGSPGSGWCWWRYNSRRVLVGAGSGGLGYLIAGFHGGFAPAAVLLALIFLQEKPG